jgi:hypothetical protein
MAALTPDDRPMTIPRRSRRWDLVVLSIGAVSASLSILFWAWLTISFQLFGEQPDRADYLEAAGLYAGGLVWLGLASLVAWLAGAPRWLRWWCWLATGLLAVLLVNARREASTRDLEHDLPGNTFAGGFETAIAHMPWTWLVPVSAILALVHWSRTRHVTSQGPDGT